MAPKASTSNLGVLSFINNGSAVVNGLQKIRIADVTRVHQVNMATQQLFKIIRQRGPALGAGTRDLRVQLHQKVKVAGVGIEFRAGRRAKEFQMGNAVPFA